MTSFPTVPSLTTNNHNINNINHNEEKENEESSFNLQIYSRVGCKYCILAKELLKEYKIPYQEINIFAEQQQQLDYSLVIQDRIVHTKTTTVPQIYIGKNLLGGYDQLVKAMETATFWELLKQSNIPYSLTIPPSLNRKQDESPLDEEEKSSKNKKNESPRSLRSSLFLPKTTNEVLNSLSIRKNILQQLSFTNDPSSSSLPSKDIKNTIVNIEELSLQMYHLSSSLLEKHTIQSRRFVNYTQLFLSTEFLQYVLLSTELALLPKEQFISLSDEKKLCFYVNLYNALVIHGKCVYPPSVPSSSDLTETFQFFTGSTGVRYSIGGLLFSLDDLEHGILRANQPHPKQRDQQSVYFHTEGDERSLFAINRDAFDPRIHFVLNCGAKSCPAISVLTEENLEESLLLATINYLVSEIEIVPTHGLTMLEQSLASSAGKVSSVVYLPKLLLWYGIDFGATVPDQMKRINQYFSQYQDYLAAVGQSILLTTKKLIEELKFISDYFDSEEFRIDEQQKKKNNNQVNEQQNPFSLQLGKYLIEYKPYNWSLNQL